MMEDLEKKTNQGQMISPEKREKYLEEIGKDGDFAVKMIDESEWELIQESEDVKLFRTNYKDSSYMIYRSTMYIDEDKMIDAYDYVNYENDPLHKNEKEEMKKRDPLVIERRIVEEYEVDESVTSFLVFTRNTSGSYWVYDREFLYLTTLRELNDGDHVIQVSRSVDDEDEELVKNQGGVRGKILIVLSVKREEERYRVDWILHVDPAGLIPSLLFNSTFGESVYNLAKRGKSHFENVRKN